MKLSILLLGIVFLIYSPGSAKVGPLLKGHSQDQGIRRVLTDLQGDVSQVEKYRVDAQTTQEEIDTRLFGIEGRDQILNRLGIDKEALLAYLDEGLNELGYLKEHWNQLTGDEKEFVEQAEYDLNE